MNNEPRPKYPNIVPCLVSPFERPFFQGKCRFPALVFAQRGSVVLFAAEATRQFGVGILESDGRVSNSDQFPTLDMAARIFLSHALHAE